jgi:3'-5' exoribonuclease
MVWDGVEHVRSVCVSGRPVRVIGRHDVHPRYGAQSRSARCAPPPREPTTSPSCVPGRRGPSRSWRASCASLLATVACPHLRGLLDAVLAPEAETWPAFRTAHGGQALPPGLRPRAARARARGRTGRRGDRGTRSATSTATWRSPARCCTTSANSRSTRAIRWHRRHRHRALAGHIPLGTTACAGSSRTSRVPAEKAEAVLHIILSHHGSLEHGSPVVPCTREATLVHFVTTSAAARLLRPPREGAARRARRGRPTTARWAAGRTSAPGPGPSTDHAPLRASASPGEQLPLGDALLEPAGQRAAA